MKNTEKTKGYTLIEIMVAMVILGIIASIAIPSYNGYIRNGRLQECSNEVAAIRLAQEEHFIEFDTYFGDGAIGIAALEGASRGLYNSTFTTPAQIAAADCTFQVGVGNSGVIATSYLITATGQNNLDVSDSMTFGN
jgi:prepilin-type N-terminal cleavage/methylation domain-containing protein